MARVAVSERIGWDETGDGQANHWYYDAPGQARQWFPCKWHAEQAETRNQDLAIAVADHNDNVPPGEELRA